MSRETIDQRVGRRYPTRHQKRTINIYQIAVLITIVLLLAIVIMLGLIARSNFEQSKFITEQIQYYDEQLTKYSNQINELRSGESELLDDLYYAVKEQCEHSSDETLQMLWNSEFSEDEVFIMNRGRGIIVIYGILNNHPDIRYNVAVAQSLYDMECARTNLSNKIDFYNSLFDNYVMWVREYNDSIVCRLTGGEINESKHLRIILQ